MIINGRKTNAISGQMLDVISPVDGAVFTQIPRGDEADIDLAVKAARIAAEGPGKNSRHSNVVDCWSN